MDSIDSGVVRKAEAILARAKNFRRDRVDRYELMKQIDLLYQELEDPMDASELSCLRQCDRVLISCSAATVDFCEFRSSSFYNVN